MSDSLEIQSQITDQLTMLKPGENDFLEMFSGSKEGITLADLSKFEDDHPIGVHVPTLLRKYSDLGLIEYRQSVRAWFLFDR